MLSSGIRFASWGGRYVISGLTYCMVGIAALFFVADTSPPVAASVVCPYGTFDCQGTCIPDSSICCADGTSGDSSTCCCCSNSEDDLDSIFCPDPADYNNYQVMP